MNRFAYILFLLFWICLTSLLGEEPPNPVPIPEGPLSLQTCYELAVLRSETLGMKQEDIRVAQARYWQAVSSVLPRIHSLTTESVANAPYGNFGSGGSSAGNIPGLTKDTFETKINVKQPIFSGFRDIQISTALKADVEAKKQMSERNRQLLYLDVADVYYQILTYQDDLKLLEEIHHTLGDRVKELEKRVELGKARSAELLMSRTELSDTAASIFETKGLLAASQELMRFLTDLPPEKQKLQPPGPLPSNQALEDFLTKSGERPDLLAAIQNERAARRQLSASKGEHWPTITAEGNWFLRQHPDTDRKWEVFLTMDIPIFEWGNIQARVSERRALAHSSELNVEQLRRTTEKDVRTAYQNFISALGQTIQLKEVETNAELNYKAQSEDYKLGLVNNLEVLDSLRKLYNIRRRYYDTTLNTHLNLIRLHIAAGIPRGGTEK